MFFLLILILPFFGLEVESSTSANTLYAHAETAVIGGVNYYLHKLSSADGPATTLSQSAASAGRKLMGRWVYPLNGIVSVQASTWAVTYRAMKSASATWVVAHCDIDILIRRSDNTVRTTLATNVANSPSITLVNAWETLTGTYDFPGYTVVDQTDYLEVAYYIEVTTPQSSKQVRLLVDDGTLPLTDQTKIENVIFTYPNQPPVASFIFSPSNPTIFETITFDASASYDPDGSIANYTWDFGDGNITTATDPVITHVYTTAKSTVNYTVTLTVTDNEGATDSTWQIVQVTNPSILHVSLPNGTYFGPNPDQWLSQCWILNITGLSQTFTVRIDNIHSSIESYDTHLIIVLNDAAYQYLDSLTVNSTTIPKSSFVSGTPEPYGFTLTWEEDVYPTYFSDFYVVGFIGPSTYREVQVSVSFINATGVRMHFDAYGSTETPPPSSMGHVTHNPHNEDSTVLFWPVVKYQLIVRTSGLGTYTTNVYNGTTILGTATDATPYMGLFEEGSLILLNIDSPIIDDSKRFVFTQWSGDATGTDRPVYVTMNSDKDVTANYKTQFEITFNQLGVGSDFTGTVLIVDYVEYGVSTLPVSFWWDMNSVHNFAFQSPLVVSANAKQYVWTSTSGLSTLQSGSLTVSTFGSVTGNYKTQFYLTVSSPYGSPSPTSGWFDSGTPITASVTSPWAGPTGTRYVCTGWSGTGSVPSTGTTTSVSFTINQPSSITWNWKTQYLLTVVTDPAGLSPQPSRNPVGEAGPANGWWYDATTSVTLTAQTVSGYTFTYWDVNGISQGSGVNPITVNMNGPYTATAHYTTAAPPLSVSITPMSASIILGQSVQFTSSVTGGTQPYEYQWYLGGVPVSGANGTSWTFTPTATGVYYVYLNVTDANNNTAKSGTARIEVSSVPVGGYSISLTKQTPVLQLQTSIYTALIILFGTILSLTKRKRK
jgi:PKD repeat protein